MRRFRQLLDISNEIDRTTLNKYLSQPNRYDVCLITKESDSIVGFVTSDINLKEYQITDRLKPSINVGS